CHVVVILDQAVVDVVADLLAGGADEVDTLDGLVDPLAVQDPTLQLLDADAEELLVLPLDLAPPGLVLGKLFLRLVDCLLFVVERAVCFRFRPGALVALARACHATVEPPQRVRRGETHMLFYTHTKPPARARA